MGQDGSGLYGGDYDFDTSTLGGDYASTQGWMDPYQGYDINTLLGGMGSASGAGQII